MARSVTWAGSCAQASGMPGLRRAPGVYGDAPPGIAPGHDRARVMRQQGGRTRAGAGRADHVEALPGRDRPGVRGPPRGPPRSPSRVAASAARRLQLAAQALRRQGRPRRRSRACSRTGRPSTGTGGRQIAVRIGDGDVGQPDRLRRRPAVRTGHARDRDRQVHAEPPSGARRPSPPPPAPTPPHGRQGRPRGRPRGRP